MPIATLFLSHTYVRGLLPTLQVTVSVGVVPTVKDALPGLIEQPAGAAGVSTPLDNVNEFSPDPAVKLTLPGSTMVVVVAQVSAVPFCVQFVVDVPAAVCAADIPENSIAAMVKTYEMPRVCCFMLDSFPLMRLTLTYTL